MNNKKQILEEDAAKTYNQFKEFEGKKYTGMKVGGRHKWHYEKGEWNEKKVAPDRWEFSYAVPKRRAGHAPPGSGVPVGTEYHWYILGHQNVRKLDENTYSTSMTGLKYKLAHRRAGKETWSASEQAQRRQLVKILQEMIDDLSAESPVMETAEHKPAPGRRNALRKPKPGGERPPPQLNVSHGGAPQVEGVRLPPEDEVLANSRRMTGARCGAAQSPAPLPPLSTCA